MIGKTNVNGTSDTSGVGAVLSIDALIGSTVTVSQGSFSKVLRKPIEISTYFSRYFYLVTPSRFGSWTVTATNGTDSVTATVTIDSNKQYDLSMAPKWFIRDGVLVNPLFEIFGNVTASQGSGVYTIQTTSNNTGGLKVANVDLSRFTTIVLELSSDCKSWKGTGVPAVGYGNGIKLSDDNVVGFTGSTYLNNATGSITQGQYTVDVSAVNGSYEVACSVGGSNSLSPKNGILNIVNAYLK